MRNVLLAVTVLALAACGDPATEDPRGYTKAPLENPGLLIGDEPEPALAGVPTTLEPGLTAEPLEAERPAAGEDEGGGDTSGGGETQVSLAEGVTQAEFDQGRDLFSGSGGCTACHGVGGSGSQLGPSLTDDQWLHVDGPDPDALAGVIRSGVPDPIEYPGPMPAMGGANLTDEQVEALAGYVASIGGG
ncbi:MAG: c-type cytochrome [Candidatus Longimicrobiales bacterium M2_2A_002]